jgi:creatinine amidohydrolase
MKKVKLEEYNEYSFQQAKIDKAILAIGSTESHGGHLPFGCDTFVSYGLALEVAQRLENTVVVPPMWYGMSLHYSHKPMCVSLTSDTLIQVYREILESLVAGALKRSWSLSVMTAILRQLKLRRVTSNWKPGYGVGYSGCWWMTAGSLLPKDTFEVWNGLGHGGEGETSIALAMFPELCDLSQARGMLPEMDPHVKLVWNFEELTDYGASGGTGKRLGRKGTENETGAGGVFG